MLNTVEHITVTLVDKEELVQRTVPIMQLVGKFAIHVTGDTDSRTDGFKTDAFTVTHVPTGRALLAGIKNKTDAVRLAVAADALGVPDDGRMEDALRRAVWAIAQDVTQRKTFKPAGARKKTADSG